MATDYEAYRQRALQDMHAYQRVTMDEVRRREAEIYFGIARSFGDAKSKERPAEPSLLLLLEDVK